MELRRSFLIKLMLGAIIGMFIPIAIMFGTDGADYIDSHGLILLKQIIGSMIYGAIAMGGSVVYEIESWSIVRATSTHYILTMSSFLIANYLLEWFGNGIWLAVAFICMTMGYLIIWLVQSALFSRRVKEMNEELEKLRSVMKK